jgi:hypothetical protein
MSEYNSISIIICMCGTQRHSRQNEDAVLLYVLLQRASSTNESQKGEFFCRVYDSVHVLLEQVPLYMHSVSFCYIIDVRIIQCLDE